MKCFKCNRYEAVNPYKCLVIKRHVMYNQAEESLIGTQEAGLCNSCLSEAALQNCKLHPLYPLQAALIGIGAAAIGMMLIVKEAHPVLIAAAAVTLIPGLIIWRKVVPATAHKYAHRWIGSCSMDGAKFLSPGEYRVLVPIGEKMYKNRKHFDKLNPYLSAGMAEKVFNEAIGTGLWKRLPDVKVMDELREKEEEARRQAEEKLRRPLPDASDPEFFSACVERLVLLYQKKPDGYLTSQAGEVRAVGEKLAEAGGMDMMLEAHAAFARQNGRMARNLEMVWDGIGGWAG